MAAEEALEKNKEGEKETEVEQGWEELRGEKERTVHIIQERKGGTQEPGEEGLAGNRESTAKTVTKGTQEMQLHKVRLWTLPQHESTTKW